MWRGRTLPRPGQPAVTGPGRLNLIALNPWEDPASGPSHRPASEEDAARFTEMISAAGFVATLLRRGCLDGVRATRRAAGSSDTR